LGAPAEPKLAPERPLLPALFVDDVPAVPLPLLPSDRLPASPAPPTPEPAVASDGLAVDVHATEPSRTRQDNVLRDLAFMPITQHV
jgi:hypothetical protein